MILAALKKEKNIYTFTALNSFDPDGIQLVENLLHGQSQANFCTKLYLTEKLCFLRDTFRPLMLC